MTSLEMHKTLNGGRLEETVMRIPGTPGSCPQIEDEMRDKSWG